MSFSILYLYVIIKSHLISHFFCNKKILQTLQLSRNTIAQVYYFNPLTIQKKNTIKTYVTQQSSYYSNKVAGICMHTRETSAATTILSIPFSVVKRKLRPQTTNIMIIELDTHTPSKST